MSDATHPTVWSCACPCLLHTRDDGRNPVYTSEVALQSLSPQADSIMLVGMLALYVAPLTPCLMQKEQAAYTADVQMTSLTATMVSSGAFLGRSVHSAPVRPIQPHATQRRNALDQQRVVSSQQASTSGDSSRNLSSRGKSSTRAWQHQWRYMRSERARTDQSLPKVDWTRYHLQASPQLTLS